MDSLVNLRSVDEENFEVEFEAIPLTSILDERKHIIYSEINSIDKHVELLQHKVEEINADIDRLTCHADGFDYMIAVACGVLTGAIDVFLVGEFDFTGSKELIDSKIDKFITDKANNMKMTAKVEEELKRAKEKGVTGGKLEEIKRNIEEKYKQNPMSKSKAIEYLEKKFGIPSDSVWKGESHITPESHHLDDLAHHPTIVGLAASILTQFTKNAYFQDKEGKNIKIKAQKVKTVKKGKEKVEIILIGSDLKAKLMCGILNWLGHLLSDVAGSSSSARKGNSGMGLPGPIVSTLKELAMLPILKNTSLPMLLYDLFTKDDALFGEFRLDLRSELAFGIEGKQAIPVFINTIFIRSFYFVRRFISEAREAESIADINWRNTFPWKNRTIARLLTISLGTFEAIDLADAAIRGALKSGGTIQGFFANFVLRVNFVGIGRFAIAVTNDVSMGVQQLKEKRERSMLMSEIISLSNVKLYYKNADLMCSYSELYEKEATMHSAEADMWVEVDKTQQAMEELYEQVENVGKFYAKTIQAMDQNFDEIERLLPDVEKMNPGLVDEMLRRLQE